MSDPLSASDADQLHAYLAALFGREPRSGRVEVRYRKPQGAMQQRFYEPGALVRAPATLRQLAQRHEVWVGVAPRTERRGTRQAIEHSWALWMDCDGDSGPLERFSITPSLTVASGSGTGHRHAYWLLTEAVKADVAASLNHRLAGALGGDAQSADAARILRPPDTLNHKHEPPVPVALTSFTGEPYDVAELSDALPREHTRSPAGALGGTRNGDTGGDSDPLLALAPAAYVGRLLGVTASREGKVSCPFHEDRTPSLHVYDSADRGWTCFGCGRGGSVYDLAAELWGYSTRGREFVRLRERLTEELLGA